MEQIFKKFLHTGVGMMNTAAEELQKAADDLLERNSKFAEEGKKVVDDFKKDFETQSDTLSDKLNSIVDKVLAGFKMPTNEEVENLKSRIEELEKELMNKK